MRQSKGQGLVIDGSVHKGQNLTGRDLSVTPLLLPNKGKESVKKTQSYSTVVEQAVMTQDRPLLKEILLQCEAHLIATTVGQLSSRKVSGLLSLIEEFINADSKNTMQYCYWIKEIIIRHLGVLVSNRDNLQIVGRLRQLAKKTIEQKPKLIQLRSRLKALDRQGKGRQFIPRFSYAQGKEELGEELVGSQIDIQGILDEDDFMGEFDE